MGMPERMRDVGIKKDDIPGFVDFLFEMFPLGMEINPRDMTRGDAAAIYEAAW
jgi:alcohol dehydrogenase class IV